MRREQPKAYRQVQMYNKKFKIPLVCLCALPLLAYWLTSCQPSQEIHSAPAPVEFSQRVMTIEYRILIGDSSAGKEKERIQSIIDSVFNEIDSIFNKWNPTSEVSRLNALPAFTPHPLSPELFHFLEKIDTLVTLSQGHFDPTIEPLTQLWKRKLDNHSIPADEEIAAIKPCIGWDKIQFKNGVFIKKDRRTQLDFGGVAKGWCVDLMVKKLQESGFLNVFVEWGGEIKAAGNHPSGRPWKVFISRFGNPDPTQAIAQCHLIDQAIATSGDYYQNWTVQLDGGEERRYSHLINPLTFMPQEIKDGAVASSSVLAEDCMTADALAKVPMLFEDINGARGWIIDLQDKHPEMQFWLLTR